MAQQTTDAWTDEQLDGFRRDGFLAVERDFVDADALARIAQELVRDPHRRAALAECGARLARPNASQEIVRGLLERAGV